MIEARAKEQGLKIINVVRRSEQAEEMRAGGVRHVLASDAADFDQELSALCRQLRCRMAFDAVGGALTGQRRGGDGATVGGTRLRRPGDGTR
jgi:NADPH2:quinone reductase